MSIPGAGARAPRQEPASEPTGTSSMRTRLPPGASRHRFPAWMRRTHPGTRRHDGDRRDEPRPFPHPDVNTNGQRTSRLARRPARRTAASDFGPGDAAGRRGGGVPRGFRPGGRRRPSRCVRDAARPCFPPADVRGTAAPGEARRAAGVERPCRPPGSSRGAFCRPSDRNPPGQPAGRRQGSRHAGSRSWRTRIDVERPARRPSGPGDGAPGVASDARPGEKGVCDAGDENRQRARAPSGSRDCASVAVSMGCRSHRGG